MKFVGQASGMQKCRSYPFVFPCSYVKAMQNAEWYKRFYSVLFPRWLVFHFYVEVALTGHYWVPFLILTVSFLYRSYPLITVLLLPYKELLRRYYDYGSMRKCSGSLLRISKLTPARSSLSNVSSRFYFSWDVNQNNSILSVVSLARPSYNPISHLMQLIKHFQTKSVLLSTARNTVQSDQFRRN